MERIQLRFLLLFGVGPLAFVLLINLLTGFGLRDMWGTPLFNLSGLLAIVILGGHFLELNFTRIVIVATTLTIMIPAMYAAHVYYRSGLIEHPARVNWPQQEIASRLSSAYYSETGHYPAVVAGSDWLAGQIALFSPSRPSVLFDGDQIKSPWISGRDRNCGILAVWQGIAPGIKLSKIIGSRKIQKKVFNWSRNADALPIVISFSVIPANKPLCLSGEL